MEQMIKTRFLRNRKSSSWICLSAVESILLPSIFSARFEMLARRMTAVSFLLVCRSQSANLCSWGVFKRTKPSPGKRSPCDSFQTLTLPLEKRKIFCLTNLKWTTTSLTQTILPLLMRWIKSTNSMIFTAPKTWLNSRDLCKRFTWTKVRYFMKTLKSIGVSGLSVAVF